VDLNIDLPSRVHKLMVQSKIETFTAMLIEQPENAMIWYGLASEQYKLENWGEAAKSLRQAGDLADAQQAWRDGIEVADRTGAWKAGQHMRALLAGVASADEALCPD
jgi:uncharacterized protein HemY